MAPDQQTPLTNPQQKPSVDDLIAHTNHQVYTFHAAKAKRSLKSRLMDLPRTKKLLLAGGGASLLFIVLLVSLTLQVQPGGNLTSTRKQGDSSTATTMTASGTADKTNESTTLAGDTNGDGIVDENDSTNTSEDTTTLAEQDVSWWQQLLSVVGRKDTTTTSSDSTSNVTASSSSSAVVSQENTEESQEEEQTSTPPPAATPAPQIPTAPATGASPPTTTTAPTPSLNGVTNFRDAAASSSGLMKGGILYRSAKLQKATSSDRAKLAKLLKNGVIIDLRTKGTRTGAPDGAISGVTNLNFAINGASSSNGYVKEFVNNATDRGHFGDAVTKIANTNGSVLVHCTAGKDRTGWTVAMVMYAIGANDKQVMTEYLKSKEFGANVDTSWLNAALKEARAKNGGSIIQYIKSTSKGLGVSDATIQKLKAKLSAQ